jgi:hypothetical protein
MDVRRKEKLIDTSAEHAAMQALGFLWFIRAGANPTAGSRDP